METGAHEVDGQGGIGIPAMRLAYDESCRIAKTNGMSAIAIRNVGHTGRHGFFADQAAQKGFLTIMTGGGNRQQWRQVAPYGGIKAMLPTNPWCMGAPGGRRAAMSLILQHRKSRVAGSMRRALLGRFCPRGV